jgi:hypothetical protein
MEQPRSSLGISGHVQLLLLRRGVVRRRIEGENLFVDGGLLHVVQYLGGTTSTPVAQMICGSDNSWPTPPGSLTALGAQPPSSVPKALSGGQITYPTPSMPTGQKVVQFSATWAETENNSFTINEVGLFAPGPLLIARYVLPNPGVSKLPIEQLVINYSLIVQAV